MIIFRSPVPDYEGAYVIMRKHRVNLNLLADHDEEKFISNIKHFISQLSVDSLCLFISDLQ